MFDTKQISETPDVIATDGAEVRILCTTPNSSMSHFRLLPGSISHAITHLTIDEVWFIAAGAGRMWLQFDDSEEVVDLRPGLSISLPLGTSFQYRCDGDDPLDIVGVASPAWPGDGEAVIVDSGPWKATV